MYERRGDQSFLPRVARLTGAMSHCKQVLVQWVPAQGGDGHLACSVKLEPPERKKRAFVLSILICTILIILEVCEGRRREEGGRREGGGRRGGREGGGRERGRREGREEEGRREEGGKERGKKREGCEE